MGAAMMAVQCSDCATQHLSVARTCVPADQVAAPVQCAARLGVPVVLCHWVHEVAGGAVVWAVGHVVLRRQACRTGRVVQLG
jgi:hypothetical protein